MKRWVLAGLLATMAVGRAYAGAIDDGNAGLDALNRGSYDQAIQLFSRALKSGELAGDDKEFAYLNRGKAYLHKRQYALAVSDLQAAVKLAPDDSAASSALAEAQAAQTPAAKPVRSAKASAKSSNPDDSVAGWGYMGRLAGRTYWNPMKGKDPHYAVLHYEWLEPQSVLRYTIRSKHDKIAAGVYKLDPATGKIVEAEALYGTVIYGTATATKTGGAEYFFVGSTPLKSTTTFAADGSVNVWVQRYADGTWQDSSTAQYTEASEADLESAGFVKTGDKN